MYAALRAAYIFFNFMFMAKIKLGSMVTDIRGAVSGSVFLKGKGGAVVRQNVVPVFRDTASQRFYRNSLASWQRNWRTLSVAQRVAWNNAAALWPTNDMFGSVIIGSGINLYMRLNQIRFAATAVALTLPPVAKAMPFGGSASATLNKTGSNFTITNTASGDVTRCFACLRMSRPMSPGVFAPARKFCLINYFTVNGTTSNFFTLYTALFGSPSVGSKIFYQWYYVNFDTGQQTTRGLFSALVT